MNGGQNMDISKMKSDFKAIIGKGPLYSKGQHGKALGNSLWSFDREGIFLDSVEEGYLDLSRTCTGIEKAFAESNTTGMTFDQAKDAVFHALADEIKAVFDKNCGTDFDKQHAELCDSFVTNMKDIVHYHVTFGHAQKIVNMAFKYLSCCDGAEKYEKAVFSNCHMPLDSYTIAQYKKEISKKRTIPGWSKFDGDADIELYKAIQKDVREYSAKLGRSALDTEFIWWYETAIENTAKNK